MWKRIQSQASGIYGMDSSILVFSRKLISYHQGTEFSQLIDALISLFFLYG